MRDRRRVSARGRGAASFASRIGGAKSPLAAPVGRPWPTRGLGELATTVFHTRKSGRRGASSLRGDAVSHGRTVQYHPRAPRGFRMSVASLAAPTGLSRRQLLLPLALAQFICSFAGSNMNVMINDITRDLDTTVTGVQATVTLFLHNMALIMILSSRRTSRV